jgi:hypothetical protein
LRAGEAAEVGRRARRLGKVAVPRLVSASFRRKPESISQLLHYRQDGSRLSPG